MKSLLGSLIIMAATMAASAQSLAKGVGRLNPSAKYFVDFTVIIDKASGKQVIGQWNTITLGPQPAIESIRAAAVLAEAQEQEAAAVTAQENAEKKALAGSLGTKDISYALLKAIRNIQIVAKWTNFPVSMNVVRTNGPSFAIVKVNYDLATTNAPARIAAMGEFGAVFTRIDQQGNNGPGVPFTTYTSMTVLLVPGQRWYFTNLTAGGSVTPFNSAMMTLSLQP